MKKWLCRLFGLVEEAPNDGKPYVRCGKKWVAIGECEITKQVQDLLNQ
jgi:hypothetical protein